MEYRKKPFDASLSIGSPIDMGVARIFSGGEHFFKKIFKKFFKNLQKICKKFSKIFNKIFKKYSKNFKKVQKILANV